LRNRNIPIKIASTEKGLINAKIKMFVEEYLFRPVAIRKKFLCNSGPDPVLYPELIIE
jgi:hypothetical protein